MVVLMCITWAVLFVLTIVAFFKGRIFQSKDEDVWNDAAMYLDRKSSGESERTVGHHTMA